MTRPKVLVVGSQAGIGHLRETLAKIAALEMQGQIEAAKAFMRSAESIGKGKTIYTFDIEADYDAKSIAELAKQQKTPKYVKNKPYYRRNRF